MCSMKPTQEVWRTHSCSVTAVLLSPTPRMDMEGAGQSSMNVKCVVRRQVEMLG